MRPQRPWHNWRVILRTIQQEKELRLTHFKMIYSKFILCLLKIYLYYCLFIQKLFKSLIFHLELDFRFVFVKAFQQNTSFAYFVTGHKSTTFAVLLIDGFALLLDFDFLC